MLQRLPKKSSPPSDHAFGMYSSLCSNMDFLVEPIYRGSFTPNPRRIPKRQRSTFSSAEHTIPYENFIGTMLGQSIRLLGLLRHESHGDVYAAEHLSEQLKYEVKAYKIRGVSEKDREYRIRNLKRLSCKPSFVGSLEQSGMKWVISYCEPLEGPKLLLKYRGPNPRNWAKYATEFPSLAQGVKKSPFQEFIISDVVTANHLKNIWVHDTKRIVMDELKTETVRISSSCWVPSLATRLITRLIESHPSWSDEKLAMSQTRDSEKRRTPEQIERKRERQRLARKAKRLQQAACREML